MLNKNHRALMRETLRQQEQREGPRKRRRTRDARHPSSEPIVIDSEGSKDSDSTDDFADVDLEDVDLGILADTPRAAPEPHEAPDSFPHDHGDDDEFDSDDFEDIAEVDTDMPLSEKDIGENTEEETLTFAITNQEEEESRATKGSRRTFTPIPQNERRARKLAHKLILFAMLCHGAVRNAWCSDERALRTMRKVVSSEIIQLFDQDESDVLDYVKSKRFIDGLRKLVSVFRRRFRVTSRGIERTDWGSGINVQSSSEHNLTFDDFLKGLKSFKGSRDLGAQAFVALLRSIGVNARLVFSIQTPDFRSIRPAKNSHSSGISTSTKASNPASEFAPVFIPNPRQAMLQKVRTQTKSEPSDPQMKKTKPAAKIPNFWIEVYNKYSKKWITIDPIVLGIVEVIPMRRKSKLEAPATDETHQTWYVIGYDKYGCARDITRRYTQFFNAKTVKKRINYASEEDANWYNRILRAVACSRRPISFAEAVELREFHDRHVCEGTPNNMADFKDHPVYALESQLRKDEVIYPNDDTSKCGTFRSAQKGKIITIYKRSNVHRLKTAKAWYMNGRVLKVGAQPLKTTRDHVQLSDENPDDDGQIRMYAEFQTELFRPAPIVDGKIPKNAYGNIEIFKPTMLPENGFLATVSPAVPLKMLEMAARVVLNIDYAKAIVGFEFGKAQRGRGSATAKEGGIVIDSQYKEGFLAVVEGLREIEESKKREETELKALRSWKFFLTKLQIVKRLEVQHGKITQEKEDWKPLKPISQNGEVGEDEEEEEEDGGYFSVGSEGANSENDVYIPRSTRRSRKTQERESMEVDKSEEEQGGGFVVTSHTANDETDSAAEEGGFFIDTEMKHNDSTQGGFNSESDEMPRKQTALPRTSQDALSTGKLTRSGQSESANVVQNLDVEGDEGYTYRNRKPQANMEIGLWIDEPVPVHRQYTENSMTEMSQGFPENSNPEKTKAENMLGSSSINNVETESSSSRLDLKEEDLHGQRIQQEEKELEIEYSDAD